MLNPNTITSIHELINYTYVSPDKIDIWESRGFKENKDFSLNLLDDPEEYIVMTRKPISLINYGKERLIGSEIIDLCVCIGSYGMGGPGYFGFKVNVKNDIMWLVACIWNAEGYIMLDDRVFYTADQYKKDYNPWYRSSKQFDKYFKNELLKFKIKNLTVYDTRVMLDLEKEGFSRQINIYKNDKRLPPMGSGTERIDAFSDGCISDYLMVIHDDTYLFVD